MTHEFLFEKTFKNTKPRERKKSMLPNRHSVASGKPNKPQNRKLEKKHTLNKHPHPHTQRSLTSTACKRQQSGEQDGIFTLRRSPVTRRDTEGGRRKSGRERGRLSEGGERERKGRTDWQAECRRGKGGEERK